MELKLGKAINYDILISPSANNGFIVKIGCGRFVAANKNDLLDGLEAFLNSPEDMESEYNNNACNSPAESEETTQGALVGAGMNNAGTLRNR